MDGGARDMASPQQVGASSPVPNISDRILTVVHDMGASIQALEKLLVEYAHTIEEHGTPPSSLSKKRSVVQLRPRKEKEEKDSNQHGKSEHGIFGIFHRRSRSLASESGTWG